MTIYLMQALGIGLATQAIGGAIGGALGLGASYLGNQMQLGQNQALLNQQTAYNENLSNYNLGLQEKLWNDTNYPAQVQQMTDAGINPAMMFAKGMGSGGTTMANTVATSQPSVQQNPALNIESMMSAGQRAASQAAQTNNTVAGTLNTEQNTKNQAEQQIILQNQQVITKAQADISDATVQDTIQITRGSLQSILNNNVISVAKGYVDQNTANTLIAQAKADLLQTGLKNILLKSEADMTDAQASAITEAVKQKWVALNIDQQNTNINKGQLAVAQTNAGSQQTKNAIDAARLDWQKELGNVKDSTKLLVGTFMQTLGIATKVATAE
nr:MAG: DNA pilot protein [Microviridae sp.]